MELVKYNINLIDRQEYSISFRKKLINNFHSTHSGLFLIGEDERVSLNGSIEMYCNNNGTQNNLNIIYRNNTNVIGGSFCQGLIINKWYNFVINITSTELKGYTDNVLTLTEALTNGLPDGIYDTNYFGCFNNSAYPNTKDDYLMDDFRIYNKALTATEIGYLANNMVPDYNNPFMNYNQQYHNIPY